LPDIPPPVASGRFAGKVGSSIFARPDPGGRRCRSYRPERRHLRLFINYASPDFDRAAALHARLVAAGFSVWFDKVRLDPGCNWHKEIKAGCEAARVILPLLTPRWQNSE
jgi:hypothetical protein